MNGSSDVLIVGAGPAGCAAGITLAKAGVDVCVVDAAQFPRPKTCGDALSMQSVSVLDRLGVLPSLLSGPHALMKRGEVVFPNGKLMGRDYQALHCIVPRLVLDDALRQQLENTSARLIQHQRVTALRQDNSRVVGAEAPGWRWDAKLVITADGAGSIGLPTLGRSKPRGKAQAVSITAYYRNVAFPQGAGTVCYYMDRELPCGYGWIFPAVDGVANIGVYQRSDAYERTGKHLQTLLDEFLQRHADRFKHAERIGKPRVWPLPLAPSPGPVCGPGLLLAGDAAGLVNPFSGEGIWQALYSGCLAAETAEAIIRGGDQGQNLHQYRTSHELHFGQLGRKKYRAQAAIAGFVKWRLYQTPLLDLMNCAYRRQDG